MLVDILMALGLIGLCVFGCWVMAQAMEPIDGVNEPGLYRKLKDQEEGKSE